MLFFLTWAPVTLTFSIVSAMCSIVQKGWWKSEISSELKKINEPKAEEKKKQQKIAFWQLKKEMKD